MTAVFYSITGMPQVASVRIRGKLRLRRQRTGSSARPFLSGAEAGNAENT
jgi:hypothetical protein